MPDDESPKSDKEWKSSHDRFVEALERLMAKMEKDAAKQERVANGFYLEVSRKELREHLDARALFYSEQMFNLTEQGVQVPSEYKLADGSIIESMSITLEREHTKMIEMLRGKSMAFTFFAAHLPAGKEVFILDMHMCVSIELTPLTY